MFQTEKNTQTTQKSVFFFFNHHLYHRQSEIKLGKGKLQPDIRKYLTASRIFLLGKASHEEVSGGGVKSPPASELRAALPNPALAASRAADEGSFPAPSQPLPSSPPQDRSAWLHRKWIPPFPAPPPAPHSCWEGAWQTLGGLQGRGSRRLKRSEAPFSLKDKVIVQLKQMLCWK